MLMMRPVKILTLVKRGPTWSWPVRIWTSCQISLLHVLNLPPSTALRWLWPGSPTREPEGTDQFRMNNLYKSKATPRSPWWPSVCVRWTTQVSYLAPAYMWSCKTSGGATFSSTCKNISQDLLGFYLFWILSIQAFYFIVSSLFKFSSSNIYLNI